MIKWCGSSLFAFPTKYRIYKSHCWWFVIILYREAFLLFCTDWSTYIPAWKYYRPLRLSGHFVYYNVYIWALCRWQQSTMRNVNSFTTEYRKSMPAMWSSFSNLSDRFKFQLKIRNFQNCVNRCKNDNKCMALQFKFILRGAAAASVSNCTDRTGHE